MSAREGRVPYTFPVEGVSAGQTDRYRQEIPSDGRVERLILFYPKNSRTNLRLTPMHNDQPINHAEATDSSPSIPDYVIGSETSFDLSISYPVYEGDEIGVDASNQHGSSDLDGMVILVVDHREEP